MVFPAGFVFFMAEDDYCDAPERVARACSVFDKFGLLKELQFIEAREADNAELAGFHSQACIDRLEALSAGG